MSTTKTEAAPGPTIDAKAAVATTDAGATAPPPAGSVLSIPEMLRIMDVATELRQDRELVEQQLNFDELRQRLREKLLASAQVTGEEVTPEEVDAAIERYFAGQHTFRDPPLNFETALAQLYVRRLEIARWGAILGTLAVLAGLAAWWVSQGTHRQVVRLTRDIDARRAAIQAMAPAPDATVQLNRLATEAATFKQQEDTTKLEGVRESLTEMEDRLQQEYVVAIVNVPGKKSGVDRFFTDPKTGQIAIGYYVIVEAKSKDGKVLPQTIHNNETGKDKVISSWGEQVPKAVYDRLREDKKADGVLNETQFAVKRRGQLDEQITMPGPDGKPLGRMGQITEW
jgi:hypothetical protein